MSADTIDRFKRSLVAHLKAGKASDWITHMTGQDYGGETGADPCEVDIDWPELEREIDAFCAEFRLRSQKQ